MRKLGPSKGPRRLLLQATATLALSSWLGCGHHNNVKPPHPAPPLPDVRIGKLTDVLTSAGLRWLVLAKPEAWLSAERLRPSLSRLLKDERLDALELNTGIDLRRVPELALASYRSRTPGEPDAVAYAVRHRHERALLEQRFRKRLTSKPRRRVEGHQLAMIDGKIGHETRAMASLGPEVCLYQLDGPPARGPARIALLYAGDRLKKIAPISSAPELSLPLGLLGDAPLRALLPGPFEEEMARGARGLMRSASAVAASLTPITPPLVRLSVVLFGDYSAAPDQAVALMQAAWLDLARSDLGHLLGLGQPATEPQLSHGAFGVTLQVPLDVDTLLRGLADATVQDVRDIMKE